MEKSIEVKLNDKIIRAIDFYYAFEHKDNFKIRTHITNITSRLIPNDISNLSDINLEIIIETKRPGLVIGKAGKDINSLKEYLTKELDCKVIVDIKENKLMWYSDLETDPYEYLDYEP